MPKLYPSPPWSFVTPDERGAILQDNAHLEADERDAVSMLDAYRRNSLLITQDDDAPRVSIPRDVLNMCLGEKPDSRSTATGKLLVLYAEVTGLKLGSSDNDQLGDITPSVFKGPKNRDNRVREISTRDMVRHGVGVSLVERWKRLAKQEKVHVVTGESQSRAPLSERRITYKEDQKLVAQYFDRRRTRHDRYRPTLEAVEAAAEWAEATLTQSQLEFATRHMRAANAVPRYQPAKRRATARLFDDTPWGQMRSELRRRIMPQWVELDLSAAYLAIFLKVLEAHDLASVAPRLAACVGDNGTGVWPRALAAFGAPVGTTKDQLKEFTYATLFSASKATAISKLVEKGIAPEVAEHISESPLAKELRRALHKLKGWYANRGHLVDAYGMEAKNVGLPKQTTVIHFVCSSWELRLVARAYEVAESAHPSAYVALHQHDGVALGHDEPSELATFVASCQAAVNNEARRLGVRTSFICKE